jgi:hypothetical protein
VTLTHLFLPLILLAALLGCSQRPVATGKNTTPVVSAAAAAQSSIAISKEDAIAIVATLARERAPDRLEVEVDAHTIDNGFRIFVSFTPGVDAHGNAVHPAIGSHRIYEVSRFGEVKLVSKGL